MKMPADTWWQRCRKLTQSALTNKWTFLVINVGALAIMLIPPSRRLLDPADLSFSFAFFTYSVVFGLLMRAIYSDVSKSERFLSDSEWSRVKLRRAIRAAVSLAIYNLMLDYSQWRLNRFSFIGAAFVSGVIFLIVYFSQRPDTTHEGKVIDHENFGKPLEGQNSV
jgi:hypothetical protein